MVPISAHALFARPLVVGPDVHARGRGAARHPGPGVLWCDGRRTVELPPGARIEVVAAPDAGPAGPARTGPFTDRLVAKFQLPVDGWRGPAAARDGRRLSRA